MQASQSLADPGIQAADFWELGWMPYQGTLLLGSSSLPGCGHLGYVWG